MQGIYNYIPETNHVPRVHSVAPVLYLQYVLHVMLFRQWNMFRTFTLVLSAVCVQCQILFYAVPLFRAFPGVGSGTFWMSSSSSSSPPLKFFLFTFCSPNPLFQSPYSSMSVIASFKQTVSIKMIRNNGNNKLTRLQEIKTEEWKNI